MLRNNSAASRCASFSCSAVKFGRSQSLSLAAGSFLEQQRNSTKQGLNVVLQNARALEVCDSKTVSGAGVSLLGSLAKPLRRFSPRELNILDRNPTAI